MSYLVNAHRAEFRADLLELGVDLAVWWRDRRWAALYELFTQLPSTARTKLAISQTPETAKMLAEEPEAQGAAELPLNAMTPQMIVSLAIYDRLADLTQATLDTIPGKKGAARPRYGGKPIPVEKSQLQIERAKFERRVAVHWSSEFFPHSDGFE